MTLQIIYQDPYYIAINKPAALLVHRSPIDRHETRFAVQMLRDQIGQRVYPVHRLDKPTSGVLLFAFSAEAASKIGILFQQHDVYKSYFAIVRGYSPAQAYIDHPVKAAKDAYDEKLRELPPNGITQLTQLATAELDIPQSNYSRSRFSLVKLEPKTGCKHQLRYHMKHISHPIIGDPKYGKGNINRSFADKTSCSRLLLSAYQLQCHHPYLDDIIDITAPLLPDFQVAINALHWQAHFNEQGYYHAP